MTRNEDDVEKSMIKHNWWTNHANREYNKFKPGIPKNPKDVYKTKIEFSKSLNAIELPYNELEKTEGYIQYNNRVGWGVKQTK